jgi:acyl-CoA thioesterase
LITIWEECSFNFCNKPRRHRMTRFITIEQTNDPNRYNLPLTPEICVGPPTERFMLGGVGLGAAITIMEEKCELPLACATAQFVSFARAPDLVEFEFERLSVSRYLTQASVTARSAGRTLFRVNGALGTSRAQGAHCWIKAPDVPSPTNCPEGLHWRGDDIGLHGRLEVRVAKGRYGRDRIGFPEPDGKLSIWVRPRDSVEIDVQILAVIADLLPNGVGNAIGANAGGSSLDNTLRVIAVRPTNWILAEISIQAIECGIAHGEVFLFTEDRQLLAIASQTLVLRIRD